MKMVRAVIRPESTELVVDALAASGFVALTRIQAFGRGKQKGIDSGNVHYDELPKNLLMLVVEDEHVPQVLEVVQKQAKTGNYAGQNYGRITQITDSEVVLTEIVQDELSGDWVERVSTLVLQE